MTQPNTSAVTTQNVAAGLRPPKVLTAKQHTAHRIAAAKAAVATKRAK